MWDLIEPLEYVLDVDSELVQYGQKDSANFDHQRVEVVLQQLDLHGRRISHNVICSLQRSLTCTHLLNNTVQLSKVMDSDIEKSHSLNRTTAALEHRCQDVIQLRWVQTL